MLTLRKPVYYSVYISIFKAVIKSQNKSIMIKKILPQSYILVTGIYLVLLGVLMQNAVLLDGHRGWQGNRVRSFLPFLLTTALHP